MFETASRKKFRFPSVRGELTTEQLWDMPLTSRSGFDLDSVAKDINHDLKAQAEESFVERSNNAAKNELQAKLDIVVHIIRVKQEENEKARTAAERKAQRDRLTEVLHVRTTADLMTKSPEEIQKMIAELGD